MRKHLITFAATALASSLLLTGCVAGEDPQPTTPGTPAPSASTAPPSASPTPTTSPTPGTATPPGPGATVTPPAGEEPTDPAEEAGGGSTPSDEPSEGPDGSDEWETITVDGWATVTIPAGWTQEKRTGESPEPGHVIVDSEGNQQVQLNYSERDRKFNPPACVVARDIDKAVTVSRSDELPNAYPGESLARITQIRKLPIYQGEVDGEHKYEDKYSLEAHLFEMDRAAANPDCAPFPGIYPDKGGVISVGIIADPHDALYFNTEEGARKYTESAEYKTIERIIESARIAP